MASSRKNHERDEAARRSPAKAAARMDGPGFAKLRQALGKNQRELAELLGVSLKAVESYEQGWRKVPSNVERLMYYILFKLAGGEKRSQSPCWTATRCPPDRRGRCVAYLAKEGRYCWFFTGRLCAGPEGTVGSGAAARGGLAGCYFCKVFTRLLKKEGVA